MKGKNGGGRGLNRVDYHLGSSMDTCKLCFLLFIYIYMYFLNFLPCNPALRSLHCLSWLVQQRQGGCVCAPVYV